MSTTARASKRARADESPFEMPALTSGYPLDAAETAAIEKVLDAARQNEMRSREMRSPSVETDGTGDR
jgi:hypothetical protein